MSASQEPATQRAVSAEIAEAAAAPTRPDGHPDRAYAPYRSTALRSPQRPLVVTPPSLTELAAPVFGAADVAPIESDLTRHHAGEPLGERIIVTGRVLDGDGRPVRNQLVEVWQANASGRYRHERRPAPRAARPELHRRRPGPDRRRGPLPLRDDQAGRLPVAQPHQRLASRAHPLLAVRHGVHPAPRHADVLPRATRCSALDPIFQSVTDEKAQQRLIAAYDHDVTQPEWALGYRWDIVLDGAHATPPDRGRSLMLDLTPSQTVGPFFAFGLPFDGGGDVVPLGTPGAITLHGTVRDGAGAAVPDALLEFWQTGPDGRVPVRPGGSLHRDGRSFTGFARVATDRAGRLPAAHPAPGGTRGRPRRPAPAP